MRNSEKIDFNLNLSKENSAELPLFPLLRLSHPVSTNYSLITEEEEEIVSRETLNSIYGDNYDLIRSKIMDTENQAINYLSDMICSLQVKYKEFNTDINSHFRNLTSKITDAFKLNNNSSEEIKGTKKEKKENLIKKYSNEYIQELKKIINMHEQIFNNIKNSISIFYDFLDISKLLSKEKPINEFLSKEFKKIIENWSYMQIDFSNFDFTKAVKDSNFGSDLKDLIIKIRKNQNFIMNISNTTKYMRLNKKLFDKVSPDRAMELRMLSDNNKKIMDDNHDNLIKLKMKNAFYVDKYFEAGLKYNKIKFLKFDNVTFSPKGRNKNNFLKNMNSLEKLIINSATNFEISILKDLSKSLIKLSLTKNGFVDYEFKNIMTNYLVNSEHIRKNLQYLSFSDNYLSNINLSQIVYQPRQSFHALKELDFQNNKIFQFSIEPEYFNDLKCINCCYNNLARNSFEQYEKILTLLSGNVFLSEKNLAKKYFDSLAKKLNNYTISLTYLNLSFIPQILSDDYLAKIIINDSILINLKKLDLSYNNLKCDTIIKFLNNNKGCLSLKSLNLSNNLLDISFFDKFLEGGLNNHFNKLKYIKLDANKFGNFENLESTPEKLNEELIKMIRILYKFIEKNNNLIELTITKNPFSNYLLIMDIEINNEENANNFSFNNYVTQDEKGNIIINNFFSFLFKIKIEMNEINKKNKSEIRPTFNIKFDCKNSINNNSSEFEINSNIIIFDNQA